MKIEIGKTYIAACGDKYTIAGMPTWGEHHIAYAKEYEKPGRRMFIGVCPGRMGWNAYDEDGNLYSMSANNPVFMLVKEYREKNILNK